MTEDDISRMALAAGFEIGSATNAIYAPMCCEKELKRFAELVAAATREACAKECDALASCEGIAQQCAAAIRARGNQYD